MSYYVIIRGPLGVGKSTIARALAETLHAAHISIDAVLAEHGLDTVGADEECIPKERFIKADNSVVPEIQRMLQQGKKVIIDGNFYHREQLDHIIGLLQYPHQVFTLKAPLDVCIVRDSTRERSYGKDAAAAVHYLVSRFEYGISIDATQNEEKILKQIREHLPQQ
jgi:predicted kinase